jgi:hypothetical protein
MHAVDTFIVYDNIEYTKKGWINRNRILVNGKDSYITLPLKKDSDYLDINERSLADTWQSDRIKMRNRIVESYRKAPQFDHVFPMIERCIMFEKKNLFEFIYHSLKELRDFLNISSQLKTASAVPADHTLKAEKKVIALCKAVGAEDYINPIGGTRLYDKKRFRDKGIGLYFIKTGRFAYPQFRENFIPNLSIIDVLMFNSPEKIKEILNNYELI